MDITRIALGGMNTAAENAQKAAVKIATAGAAPAGGGTADIVDLSAQVVELLMAKVNYEANAAVLATGARMDAELTRTLDIQA